MGLDMYAYLTPTSLPSQADFGQDAKAVEIFYWRKHPNLHGWMHELYRSKGGANPDFNLCTVQLDVADLDHLEIVLDEDRLPDTEGFFFGCSTPDRWLDDTLFVCRARQAISAGYFVFYFASW